MCTVFDKYVGYIENSMTIHTLIEHLNKQITSFTIDIYQIQIDFVKLH